METPTSSFHYGAAGIAYALLKIARVRDDERLLALADLWSHKALGGLRTADAFNSAELDLTPDTVGTTSLFHTASGVYCVDALIAHARGDKASQRLAIGAFLAASERPNSHLDVSLGRAGTLIGCSLLLDTLERSVPEAVLLRSFGDRLSSEIWSELAQSAPIGESPSLKFLGAAHGWAGILFAVLRWSEISGKPVIAGIADRLDELLILGSPIGSGLRWPSSAGSSPQGSGLWASWCNGAAGFVHLWTLAHRLIGRQKYLELGVWAAWTAYQAPHSSGDLCCGLAGRAYALLNLFKQNGEVVWVDRAGDLAERAALAIRGQPHRPNSLYKGEIGVALLAADIEKPEQSCMPFFESEGWHQS